MLFVAECFENAAVAAFLLGLLFLLLFVLGMLLLHFILHVFEDQLVEPVVHLLQLVRHASHVQRLEDLVIGF